MNFAPTPEQEAIIDLFQTGDSMVVEAGAGTGKTASLVLLGAATSRRGRYLAYNKAIAEEAKAKFDGNVAASTAHSLAFRTTGVQFKHRLDTPRMSSWHIANVLGVDPFVVTYGSEKKVLQPGYLASLTMRAVDNFCMSAAETPDPMAHIPYIDGIDLPNSDGSRTYVNNRQVRAHLADALAKAWADISRIDGHLKFKHDHYLKVWALSHPRVEVDFILLDEAQDTNPVLAKVVAEQTHAQQVLVGDACQAIYEWRGATNAMAEFDHDHRRFLSHSFRFGPAIADVANTILGLLDADLRLTGESSVESEVGILNDPEAILTRTNACAVTEMLKSIGRGQRPHLVGGGKDVLSFAEAAGKLMDGGTTYHHELACFDNWGQVQEYVDNDPQGGDLKLMVKLIDDFGVPTITRALANMPAESRADLVISTAHKAKGREWSSVRLASDFAVEMPSPSELRLLYVAVTRAKHVLDDSAVRAAYTKSDEPPVVKPDPIAMPARTEA